MSEIKSDGKKKQLPLCAGFLTVIIIMLPQFVHAGTPEPSAKEQLSAGPLEYPGEESWVQEPIGLMDIEAIDGLLSTKNEMEQSAVAQTEAEALASAKLRLGLDQIIALENLRKNPKVRFWDGRLAQGYEAQRQCSFIILGGPCQDVVVNTQSGEQVSLMGPNAKYQNTGVGKEIVRVER